MSNSVHIFISSTWLDLKPERHTVEEALQRMQASFVGMEYFGSQPETPRDVSLAEVDTSDIYLGIFAHRYGSGITEDEYRQAQSRSLPCLIYFKDDSVLVSLDSIEREPDKIAKLNELKSELQARHTVSYFKSPDHLATQVVADLHKLLENLDEKRNAKISPQVSKHQTGIPNDQHKITNEKFDSSQKLSSPISSVWDELDSIRLMDLADNVRQDRELLKKYEDALHFEDDPRRREKYEREIEQIGKSAARYQKQYNELQAKMAAKPSQQLTNVGAQIGEMNTKLDTLLAGQTVIQNNQNSLRAELLSRFDTNEQTIVSTVLEKLSQQQLETTQQVLNAIAEGQIPAQELQQTLTELQHSIVEIQQSGVLLSDPALASISERMLEVAEAPKLDVNHKLKVTVPIIPLLLNYEGEIGLQRELHLKTVWQKLLAIVKGEQ